MGCQAISGHHAHTHLHAHSQLGPIYNSQATQQLVFLEVGGPRIQDRKHNMCNDAIVNKWNNGPKRACFFFPRKVIQYIQFYDNNVHKLLNCISASLFSCECQECALSMIFCIDPSILNHIISMCMGSELNSVP